MAVSETTDVVETGLPVGVGGVRATRSVQVVSRLIATAEAVKKESIRIRC